MSSLVRVDFHCHSSFSDGSLPPEGVAQMLADTGVCCAALTDHDTIGGLVRFRQALTARGIGFLSGMEVAAAHPLGELHLLAFGLPLTEPKRRGRVSLRSAAGPAEDMRPDESPRFPAPEGPDSETREATPPGAPRLRRLHGLVDAVRRVLSPEASLAPVGEVMARIHRAGGLVFLAHPLQPVGDLDRLENLLRLLKAIGLDGLEALYKPYPREVRSVLTRLAGRHDLLVSGGSDYHGDGHRGSSLPGCNVPRWHWDRFRRALALHGCEEGGPK